MSPDEEDLHEHVYEHICEEQPEAVVDLNDEEIFRRVTIAITRARSRGLAEPEAITAYASLMFLVSPRFDDQPAILAAIADKSVPERERIATLFQKTKERDWDAAAGLGRAWPK